MRQKVASGTSRANVSDHGTGDANCPPLSLREILPAAKFRSGDDIHFHSLCESSLMAMPGDLVVYRIGQTDPVRMVADAMARGAAGILTEQLLPCPLPQCLVGDVELAAASVVSHCDDRPDQKLLTIGIIGSAGKTTTALLVSTLLRAENIRVAYQTDLGCCDGVIQSTDDRGVPAGASLVRWMSEAVDCESQVGIIELDDQQARQGGYDSVQFDMIIVTGNSNTRQDFGPSALACVLDCLKNDGVVVAPADDTRASRVIHDSGARSVTYGVRRNADVTAKMIEQDGGVSTLLVTCEGATTVFETTLCGGAMAANHAAAAAVGLLVDVPLHRVVDSLGSLRKIPGRQQRLSRFGQASVTIDVAGTPDRCASSLRSARSMRAGGRLWCIAAIADDHGNESLARLGNLLERFADNAIVTSIPDRRETFLSASHQVLDGVEKCAAMRLVADPRRAIEWVLSNAAPQDTILWLTNDAADSSHGERNRLEQYEKQIESIWDQQTAIIPEGKNLKIDPQETKNRDSDTAGPNTASPKLKIVG